MKKIFEIAKDLWINLSDLDSKFQSHEKSLQKPVLYVFVKTNFWLKPDGRFFNFVLVDEIWLKPKLESQTWNSSLILKLETTRCRESQSTSM